MKISVALATYNGERFVEEQLRSLLSQTRKIDEVIIIDDVSTDKTADKVASFIKENRLDWSFFKAESNSGYIKNFYNCLKKCTGDIIFLCDQDDAWYEDKCERIMSVFENDKKALAVNSSFDMTDADGKITVPYSCGRKSSNHGLIPRRIDKNAAVSVELSEIIEYNISPGCTCAFKREVVEEYLEGSRCILPHDWELNIIAAKRDGLRFLNVPLIGYRQHGGNAIGLSVGNSFGPLKMRGGDGVRLSVARLQSAQYEVAAANYDENDRAQREFVSALKKFCENRKKILFEKRLWPCFCNFFLYPKIKNVATVRFRGLLGDIVFVIKHKGDKNDK